MPSTADSSRLNAAWADVVVQRLYRHLGIGAFCLAPGSRSAPLALALARLQEQEPQLPLYTHFDERGLAFFALGLTQSLHTPVAVVTTSGSAVPNLFPAVAEAYQMHRPLLLLTADRPQSLHHCGANQTLPQLGLFGTHVRHCLGLPSPDWSWTAQTLIEALEAAAAALSGPDCGPVQINLPFEEPLYGGPADEDDAVKVWRQYPSDLRSQPLAPQPQPSPRLAPQPPSPSLLAPQDSSLPPQAHRPQCGIPQNQPPPRSVAQHPPLPLLHELPCPLLGVAGQLNCEEADAVLQWATREQVPVLADFGSQLRLLRHPQVLAPADLLLATPHGRELANQFAAVVQFGGRITSRRVNEWLAAFPGPRWLLSAHSAPLDPARRARQWQVPAAAWAQELSRNPQDPTEVAAPEHSSEHSSLPETTCPPFRQGSPDSSGQGGQGLSVTKPGILGTGVPPLHTGNDAGGGKQLPLQTRLQTLQQQIEQKLATHFSTDFSELTVARDVVQYLPATMALFAGNSLSVRLLDSLAATACGQPCFSNRGASGIDGLLATAVGVAAGLAGGATLLLGDLSLLHDLNSLALAATIKVPLVIVVLNNDGGGIFDMLPARAQGTAHSRLFRLPHGRDFRHAAAQFGLPYVAPTTRAAWLQAYQEAAQQPGCQLIELSFLPGASAQALRDLVAVLQNSPLSCRIHQTEFVSD